jgi:RimJ/RimL family protein N-acetyltransferase
VAAAVEGLIVVDDTTAPLLEAGFPFTRKHLGVRSPVTGVVRDGSIVAMCASVRARPGEAEAGVSTSEAWRGRGFARASVAAWRDAVESEGRTPFYSTSWSNGASLAVARALALEPFAEEFSIP